MKSATLWCWRIKPLHHRDRRHTHIHHPPSVRRSLPIIPPDGAGNQDTWGRTPVWMYQALRIGAVE